MPRRLPPNTLELNLTRVSFTARDPELADRFARWTAMLGQAGVLDYVRPTMGGGIAWVRFPPEFPEGAKQTSRRLIADGVHPACLRVGTAHQRTIDRMAVVCQTLTECHEQLSDHERRRWRALAARIRPLRQDPAATQPARDAPPGYAARVRHVRDALSAAMQPAPPAWEQLVARWLDLWLRQHADRDDPAVYAAVQAESWLPPEPPWAQLAVVDTRVTKRDEELRRWNALYDAADLVSYGRSIQPQVFPGAQTTIRIGAAMLPGLPAAGELVAELAAVAGALNPGGQWELATSSQPPAPHTDTTAPATRLRPASPDPTARP